MGWTTINGRHVYIDKKNSKAKEAIFMEAFNKSKAKEKKQEKKEKKMYQKRLPELQKELKKTKDLKRREFLKATISLYKKELNKK